MRPSKNEYYLGIAEAVSKRSTCIRRRYGAVIVKDDRIISTGYNGSERGAINCSDTQQCLRQQQGVKQGERYELCNSIHAEQNAILQANPSDLKGATMYLYGYDLGKHRDIKAMPCMMCARLIKNSGISNVMSYSFDK